MDVFFFKPRKSKSVKKSNHEVAWDYFNTVIPLGLSSLALPNRNSAVFHLNPPGFGSIDCIPVNFKPGSKTPESLLKHGGDGPVGCGSHVEKVVTSKSHGADQIL